MHLAGVSVDWRVGMKAEVKADMKADLMAQLMVESLACMRVAEKAVTLVAMTVVDSAVLSVA